VFLLTYILLRYKRSKQILNLYFSYLLFMSFVYSYLCQEC